MAAVALRRPVRAPQWWPFELVTNGALTLRPCLIVRLPRNTELFLWWERHPHAMIKHWGADKW